MLGEIIRKSPLSLQDHAPTMDLVLGVLSYLNDSFRNASGNIGDSIQTLAALNCYRHALGLGMPFAEFLERVLTDSVPGAKFVFISRDSSHRQQLPPRVVTLMNGWFMDPGRQEQVEWPMHESIEPVFVSFHLADERLLTPAGIAYFKRFQPIGCRDAATVDRLRFHGIEAYFSGCLTLTIDFLPWTGGTGQELFVDVKRDGQQAIRHWEPILKNRDPATMLRGAYAHLKRYSLAPKITTSRLHCFLPCVAIGVPVTLTDVNLQDPRLRGVDTWEYGRLRHSLARDAGERLRRLLSPAESRQPPTFDVCFVCDARVADHLPVVVHSIVHNNRHARIRVHLIHEEGIRLPAVDGVEVLSYPAHWQRPSTGLRHVSRASMLRLLIPELIREDIRLLSLDLDLVVSMCLDPIFAVDPGPTGIAMKSACESGEWRAQASGGQQQSLPGYDWSRSGNTGVILMDLTTLRRNGFTEFCLQYPEVDDDQILINRYCQGEHAELKREWNLCPPQESQIVSETDQFVLHFAGPQKPWSETKPNHWQIWNWHARRLKEKAAVARQSRVETGPGGVDD
jgi:lipopolysaccharide biosynthesis glycosyltransferase